MYDAICGTALCYVVNPLNEKKVLVRALLDSGANISILEQDSARKINLSGKQMPLSMKVAGGGACAMDTFETVFYLESLQGLR